MTAIASGAPGRTGPDLAAEASAPGRAAWGRAAPGYGGAGGGTRRAGVRPGGRPARPGHADHPTGQAEYRSVTV